MSPMLSTVERLRTLWTWRAWTAPGCSFAAARLPTRLGNTPPYSESGSVSHMPTATGEVRFPLRGKVGKTQPASLTIGTLPLHQAVYSDGPDGARADGEQRGRLMIHHIFWGQHGSVI